MIKQKLYFSSLAFALSAVIGCLSTTAQAAPGTLSQVPLSISTSAEPNVLFVNDDSGSMDWEVLVNDQENNSLLKAGRDTHQPALVNGSCTTDEIKYDYGYGYIVRHSDNLYACTAAEEEWRVRFYGYNHLYYNPSVEYKPWAGHTDADINNAKLDPNNPVSDTIDLTRDSAVLVDGEAGADATRNYYSSDTWTTWCTSHGVTTGCIGWRYYTWNDANNNNIVDEGELDFHWVRDLDPGTGDNPPVNNQKNFANWFTYHRKREYVAKYAISKAIQETDGVRMGFATINSTSHNQQIQAADADKSNLLSAVQQVSSAGLTPLIGALTKAGQYYKERNFFGTTNAPDPIVTLDQGGACQSNNTILMTDGYYSDSGTLASTAALYHDNDLRPSPSLLDGTQRMNTYTVGFGVKGTLNPLVLPDDPNFAGWPDPIDTDPKKIDDLWHAAVNGHGLYLSADNSDELVNALSSALSNITSRTQSATAAATSSIRLREGSYVYSSNFNPLDWSGQLLAQSIDNAGGLSTAWNAADQFPANRTILSFNGSNGVAFQWGADACTNCISPTMKAALTAGDANVIINGTDTPVGPERLKYLRGENTSITTFRNRNSLLADIVNSSPVHVGAPASSYPDTAPYGDSDHRYFSFWRANQNRTKVVYVGANDGMLHGFNAETGTELMAYVPATVAPDLHQLTDPDYGDTLAHRYFVDATPTVADAYFTNQALVTPSWKTVLVGGLGAGGKGLYALDITNPSNFSESATDAANTVLWEFNSGDDADLGYTFSQPVIGLMEDGRWAAVIGNGYNSDSGVATLFIIYLDADPSDGWQLNSDYRKISVNNSADDTTDVDGNPIPASINKNGLSSPTAIDSDGDGKIDRVYAGDLKGNMWAFSLSGGTGNWGVAFKGGGNNALPLFKAVNDTGEVQPITVKPSVIRNPTQATLSSTKPNLLVLFGTGQYLTKVDISNKQTQSFYSVWDKNQAIVIASGGSRNDKLVEQTITQGVDSGTNAIEARITTDHTVGYAESGNTQRFGWFIDLVDPTDTTTGERVVSNAVVFNDTVFFTTYTPAECGNGDGWFMFLNADNGGPPTTPMININANPLINDEDRVSLPDNANTAPSGLKTNTLGSPTLDLSGSVLINEMAKEGETAGVTRLGANLDERKLSKRISWRELRQN